MYESSAKYVVGMRVDPSDYEDIVSKVERLVAEGMNGYICVGNVHMAMEAFDDRPFREVVNRAALVTSDGVPLLWALRLQGASNARRVYGPALMLALCGKGAALGWPVGFYGGTPDALERLRHNVMAQIPKLQIALMLSPPFRPLTTEEEEQVVRQIRASGVKILFVGLGCPKQERWMAKHKDKIDAVMVGVGAAFDFIAGTKPQAPRWMQGVGLEWLFRLLTEPRRLWKRYLYHNPRFIYHFGKQLIRYKLGWQEN